MKFILILTCLSASVVFAQCSNPVDFTSSTDAATQLTTVAVPRLGAAEVYWKLKITLASNPETFVAYVTARKDASTYIVRGSGTTREIVVDQRAPFTIKSSASVSCIEKISAIK